MAGLHFHLAKENVMKKQLLIGAAALFASASASASTFTETSLTSAGTVVPGITSVGGIVVDLIGTNGSRVMSQLSASSLFRGNTGGVIADIDIGNQIGWTPAVTNALGGGIAQAAFRLSLDDGDSAAGNFDEDDNELLINGLNFGNWSDVEAENTTSLGVTTFRGFSGGGFRNNRLDTGWFFSDDTTLLGNLFTTLLNTQIIDFKLRKLDDDNQFYDFSQGIDGSLINIGSGPVVTPPPPNAVPLPAAVWLFGPALLGFLGLRKKSKSA